MNKKTETSARRWWHFDQVSNPIVITLVIVAVVYLVGIVGRLEQKQAQLEQELVAVRRELLGFKDRLGHARMNSRHLEVQNLVGSSTSRMAMPMNMPTPKPTPMPMGPTPPPTPMMPMGKSYCMNMHMRRRLSGWGMGGMSMPMTMYMSGFVGKMTPDEVFL
jgi:hypothetical protein